MFYCVLKFPKDELKSRFIIVSHFEKSLPTGSIDEYQSSETGNSLMCLKLDLTRMFSSQKFHTVLNVRLKYSLIGDNLSLDFLN